LPEGFAGGEGSGFAVEQKAFPYKGKQGQTWRELTVFYPKARG